MRAVVRLWMVAMTFGGVAVIAGPGRPSDCPPLIIQDLLKPTPTPPRAERPRLPQRDLDIMHACLKAASKLPERCVAVEDMASCRLEADESATAQLTAHLQKTWPQYCTGASRNEEFITPVMWSRGRPHMFLDMSSRTYAATICEAKRTRRGRWEATLHPNVI